MKTCNVALLTGLLTALGCGEPPSPTPEPQDPSLADAAAAAATVPAPTSPEHRVPKGERLFYLTATPGTDYGGLLGRGDRVNVLFAVAVADVHPVALTMAQNAVVLDTSDGRVGLAVSPAEAESLALAEQRGELFVLVRNPDDTDRKSYYRTTLRKRLEDLEVVAGRRRTRAANERIHGDAMFPANIPHGVRGLVLEHDLPVGAVRKGTRLDVFAILTPPPTLEMASTPPDQEVPPLTVAIALLHDARVRHVVDDRHVVVDVDLDEAAALILSQHTGELRFQIRNPNDGEIRAITKKTLRDVLEDLEVIQEKRAIRGKKGRPKKKAAANIEVIRAAPSTRSPRFQDHGVNAFSLTADDPLSTFAADVDTASYTVGRRELEAGRLPVSQSVRVEEWVNYFTYGYRPPEDGHDFSVDVEAAPSPFDESGQLQLVRVGVKGRVIDASDRQPVHLTFLVDVSGSMSSADKLGLAKESLRHLVSNLGEHDTVAIVTYAGATQVILEPTTRGDGEARIRAAIDGLRSSGGTNMGSGFELAYQQASKSFVPGHENRVVVLSDGDTNIGAGSSDQMLDAVAEKVKQGITLSTIGFGTGNYHDALMEQLANRGNGNYYYVDDLREAKRIFGDALEGTLQTIAKDVKLQVEFDPMSVVRYRLVGYENRAVADRDFRNDAVDAGEIGAGHTVTALYEIELADDPGDTIAVVRVRHKTPHGGELATERSFELRRDALHSRISDASDDFCFAASVAAFAEILRKSPHATHLSMAWVREIARKAMGSYGDREEFVRLVETASR